jgi:hypothetical protein
MVATGRYPRVTEFITAVQHVEGDEEDWILASVDLLLDGIESRLAALGAEAKARAGPSGAPARPRQARPKTAG